jgi:hypothetical protein
MMDALMQGLAIALAATIFIRAICVVHGTSPKRHRHPLLFVGFGYSYVILGAGAVFSAVEICTAGDLGGLPLWLMLAGSTGLIVFDRRMAICWTRTDCPAETKP